MVVQIKKLPRQQSSSSSSPTTAAKSSFHLSSVFVAYVVGVLTGLLLASFRSNQGHLDAIIMLRQGLKINNKDVATSSGKDFAKMTQLGFEPILKTRQERGVKPRNNFDLTTWNKQTDGGLNDQDRTLLSRLYREASSVFEYGLGESTYIANHVGVPYYAGIDSDAVWVSNTRGKVDHAFRFYLADIGPTGMWGVPKATLVKQVYQYELAPLVAEPKAFDVYMVDGRYRPACVLASFLHASSRGGDPSKTKVLLHDCGATKAINDRERNRRKYRMSDHILDLVEHSGNKLCVFQRKNTTTDEDLLEMWTTLRDDWQR